MVDLLFGTQIVAENIMQLLIPWIPSFKRSMQHFMLCASGNDF